MGLIQFLKKGHKWSDKYWLSIQQKNSLMFCGHKKNGGNTTKGEDYKIEYMQIDMVTSIITWCLIRPGYQILSINKFH